MLVSDGGDESYNLDAAGKGKILLRTRTGRNAANGLAGAASAAAARGFDTIFVKVGVIGVGWTRVLVHCVAAIIFGPLIFVSDNERDGCAKRQAIFRAGLDFYPVPFISRGGKGGLTWSTPCHLRLDVCGGIERKTWRTAIDYTAY